MDQPPPSAVTEAREPRRRAAGSAGASAKGVARREEILQGLMKKLSAQELRNPSLREVGRALGIEPAHILYYFSSREELLQQVIMRWDAGPGSATAGEIYRLDDFAQRVRLNMAIPGIIHLYLTFAAEAVDPQHAAHDFFLQRFEKVSAKLQLCIRQEQDAGTIPIDVNPSSKARQLVALSDGLQLQSLVDPTVDAYHELMDAIITMRRKP